MTHSQNLVTSCVNFGALNMHPGSDNMQYVAKNTRLTEIYSLYWKALYFDSDFIGNGLALGGIYKHL